MARGRTPGEPTTHHRVDHDRRPPLSRPVVDQPHDHHRRVRPGAAEHGLRPDRRGSRTSRRSPSTSRHYNTARATAVLILVHGRKTEDITREEITEAAARLEQIPETEPRKARLALIVLGTALGWIAAQDDPPTDPKVKFLGYPFTELGVRRGTESSLRALARQTAPTATTDSYWSTSPTTCARPLSSDRPAGFEV